MNAKKAVFLDRDGTIIHDYGYNFRADDQLTFLEGAIEGMLELSAAGYELVIVTNQSGIGRGKYTEQDYFAFDAEMRRQLDKAGVAVAGTYFCPHAPDDECDCRKPKAGMIKAAVADLGIDPSLSFFVGDKDDDVIAGRTAGCKTVRIAGGAYKHEEDADYTVATIAEFAALITKQ